MCTYCMIGDWQFRHNPPWKINPVEYPTIPTPVLPQVPIVPWNLEKLKEYYELLKAVKKLEDELGCPCEPNKADYIGIFKKRIADLTKKKQERAAKRKGR